MYSSTAFRVQKHQHKSGGKKKRTTNKSKEVSDWEWNSSLNVYDPVPPPAVMVPGTIVYMPPPAYPGQQTQPPELPSLAPPPAYPLTYPPAYPPAYPSSTTTHPPMENDEQTQQTQKPRMVWVPGTIPMRTIRKMKWGDLNNLTDEEYGYFKTITPVS